MSLMQRVAVGIDITPLRRAAMRFICRVPHCTCQQLAHETSLNEITALGVVHSLRSAGLVYEPVLDGYALTREGCKVLAGLSKH